MLGLAGCLLVAFSAGGVMVASGAGASDQEASFASPDNAFSVGRVAFLKRDYEKAMPALAFASKNGIMVADFFRAKIYSDSTSPMYNRAKAYFLLKDLTYNFSDIDPVYDRRALIASQSMTLLARMVREGIPEINLAPDARIAVDYLSHAASFFQNKDAEFELARMRINGEGVEPSPTLAMHSISRLAREGHAGASAMFADILWRGSRVFWAGDPVIRRDRVSAYYYARIAVENAPYSERVWIEDTYQRIYCGVSASVRDVATERVASWRKFNATPQAQAESLDPIGRLLPSAERTCGDGEPVDFRSGSPPVMAAPTPPQSDTIPAMHGDASGFPK